MAGEEPPRACVIVMGVAGCGKSVVGEGIAARLGWRFVEGDRMHPPENVARMRSGMPLTDSLRRGWLDAIGRELAAIRACGEGVVAACSALKRIYRDQLRDHVPDAIFLYLDVDREEARLRVSGRSGHFMPASLVGSQFSILQPPEPDERAVTLDGLLPVETLVEQALGVLGSA